MNSSGNQSVLFCPQCMAIAVPAFVTGEGEVLWWLCCECSFQGVWVDFVELAADNFLEDKGNTEI